MTYYKNKFKNVKLFDKFSYFLIVRYEIETDFNPTNFTLVEFYGFDDTYLNSKNLVWRDTPLAL